MAARHIPIPHPYVLSGILSMVGGIAGFTWHIWSSGQSLADYKFKTAFNTGIRLPSILNLCKGFVSKQDPESLGITYLKLLSSPRKVRGLLGIIADEHHEGNLLSTTVCNHKYDHPIGIGAGFDKNGDAIDGLFDLGCSFVEIGTITPYGQSGPPPPRLRKLQHSKSILNILGYNNYGIDYCLKNLQSYYSSRGTTNHHRVVGVNINIGNDEFGGISNSEFKYMDMISKIAPYASYIVINVDEGQLIDIQHAQSQHQQQQQQQQQYQQQGSSPALTQSVEIRPEFINLLTKINRFRQRVSDTIPTSFTKILEEKYNEEQLSLLEKERVELDKAGLVNMNYKPRLFLKIPCDMSPLIACKLADIIKPTGCDGIIIGGPIHVDHSKFSDGEDAKNITPPWDQGVISGELTQQQSNALIGTLFHYSQGMFPIIGSGGVFTGRDAFDKIKAGASLVQVNSAIYTDGIASPYHIRQDLHELVQQYYKQSFSQVDSPNTLTDKSISHFDPNTYSLNNLIGIESEDYFHRVLSSYPSTALDTINIPKNRLGTGVHKSPSMLSSCSPSPPPSSFPSPSILCFNTFTEVPHPLQSEFDHFEELGKIAKKSRGIQNVFNEITMTLPTSPSKTLTTKTATNLVSKTEFIQDDALPHHPSTDHVNGGDDQLQSIYSLLEDVEKKSKS